MRAQVLEAKCIEQHCDLQPRVLISVDGVFHAETNLFICTGFIGNYWLPIALVQIETSQCYQIIDGRDVWNIDYYAQLNLTVDATVM